MSTETEILNHYHTLVGMKGKIHPDWKLWLATEILALEFIMEGREGVA